MEKYKICPSCGERNSLVFFECLECETDLTSVRVVDEITEALQSEVLNDDNDSIENESASYSEGEMVRICEECDEINPANSRKCQKCEEYISDIIPTPFTNEPESLEDVFVLDCIVTNEKFIISDPVIILGREGRLASWFANDAYVSRSHAKIILSNGAAYIENLSQSNPTFVNNVQVDELTLLNDGDEIGLGGNMKDGNRQCRAAYVVFKVNP